MSAGLAEVLKAELVKARAEALELGSDQPREWIFADPRGGRLDGPNFRSRVVGARSCRKRGYGTSACTTCGIPTRAC